MYTFEQLQDAVQECTSYSLEERFCDADDINEYVLIDPYGDQDGEPFYDLDDLYDFITINEQVDEYLANINTEDN